MPTRVRCSGAPTPESCRRCGELTAPADRITSRSASARSDRPAPLVVDRNGTAAVEDDAVYLGLDDHLEIGPVHRRPQISTRGAGPPSAAARLLAPADTVAGAGWQVVHVLAVFEPDLLAGLDYRRAERRPLHLR